MLNILFVCKDNAVHSQIAECICSFLGNRISTCSSAGVNKTVLNPNVKSLIKKIYEVELGDNYFAKNIDELNGTFDLVVAINTNLDIDAGYVEKWTLSEELNEALVYEIEEKIMSILHEIKIGEIR